MSSRRERILAEIHLWLGRTTVEGLPNVFAAGGIGRKALWINLLVIVSICGIVHLVASIKGFINRGINSKMIIDAEPAEFPDVTICNLKPISESLLKHHKQLLHYHTSNQWEYFENWFTRERRRLIGESQVEYFKRVRKIFLLLIQIQWVSEGMDILGMTDKAILECSFNGIKCNHRNFSLIQHYAYLNCYTFRPNSDLKSAISVDDHESGLGLSIFSDNNFLPSSLSNNATYMRDDSGQDYHANGLSLKQYLTSDSLELPINRILSPIDNSDGLVLYVHPRNTFPFRHESFILQNGMCTTLRVVSVKNKKLRLCTNELPGFVEYVVRFNNRKGVAAKRSFLRSDSDINIDQLQNSIYQHCHCYSHMLPFQTETNTLCFFAPSHSRKWPNNDTLNRIECHRKWLLEHDLELKLEQSNLKQQCSSTYREVLSEATEWPSEEDLVDAAIMYFLNWFIRETMHRLRPKGLKLSNQTLGPKVANSNPAVSMPSFFRAGAVMQSLLKPVCMFMMNYSESNMKHFDYCVKRDLVRRNILRVNVKLASESTVQYLDSFAYDTLEILSEIGGILGLWLGVSILTFFELVELLCIIVSAANMQVQTVDEDFNADVREENSLEHWNFDSCEHFTSGIATVIDD